MTRPEKIAILLYEDDVCAIESHYIIWRLRDAWQEQGIRVEIVRGIDHPIDADLVFPHIDLTAYPDDYIAFLAAYPRVVNRNVWDISKRNLSRNLVARNDPWDGPVIVKTNRNCGGHVDESLLGSRATKSRMAHLRERVMKKLTPAGDLVYANTLPRESYPIFRSVDDVPSGVFANEALIVERFLPETERDGFYLRNYVFLGDQHTNSRKRASRPIVKASIVESREVVPVADEIVAERQRLQFDYGKFDYVVRDGEVALFDVNRTPTYSSNPLTAELRRMYARLASGISAIDT